jgi:hypothetical protein
MRPELEEIQLLEAYLANTLSEAQRIDVEVRLLWDQEWQRKFSYQELAYQAIRYAGRKQLRRELDSIHARLFG